MPELVTHSLVGWLLGVGLGRRWRRIDPLVVALGACLSDWLSHAFVLWPATFPYVSLLQEPAPMLLFCLLVGSFFRPEARAAAAGSLLLGAGSHYLLDLFSIHSFPVCRPLFPFSMKATGFGLYSIEASIYWVPVICVLAAVVALVRRREARHRDAGGATA